MPIRRHLFAMPAFLIGCGLGGLSLHIAATEGLFGIKDSMTQIGSSLMGMQKNVDALQKKMNMLKDTKDKLPSLSMMGGGVGGAMDSIMKKKSQ